MNNRKQEIMSDRKTLDAILEKYGKDDVLQFLDANFDDDNNLNYFDELSKHDSGYKVAGESGKSKEDAVKYWNRDWMKYFMVDDDLDMDTWKDWFNGGVIEYTDVDNEYDFDAMMQRRQALFIYYPTDYNDILLKLRLTSKEAFDKCGHQLGGVEFSDEYVFIIGWTQEKGFEAGLYAVDDYNGDPWEIEWDLDFLAKKHGLANPPVSLLQVVNLLYIELESMK